MDTDEETENLPEDPEIEIDNEEFVEELEEEETESIYDPDDFISGSKISDGGSLSLDTLEFEQYFNLTVLDESTLVFSSGNYINFLDVETKEVSFRRSALGGGLGHIRKNNNPEYPYFAVAESGNKPIIILYVWPTLEIICILRGGAEKIYTNMDFNPDGDLLVSQSGEPDFLITIWDWQRHTILLRTKSYVNDVYKVKFSPYVAGQLTTCGLAHIKFWKMASTFTGLKLKGELGRFGKTEYSDIVGVLPMPDAKVVSGCSWGNILVWDDGLITFEVFRSLRRKCHEAPIMQFYYVDGELWTISMDGHVKVWWFEKIDQADPPDDDRVILVDPTYDFYTPGVKLMSIEKRNHADASDTFWYAQDGNGGIWLIDLNTDEEPKASQQLYVCHGGKVVGLAACPFGPYIATLGELGTFYLYNYLSKKRVLEHRFPAGATFRVCCLQIREPFEAEPTNLVFSVPQVIKPHNKPITVMSVNREGTLLVTAGQDATIFIFKITIESHKDLLVPIGFYPTTDVVTTMTWHQETEILLGCMQGQLMLIQLPSDEQPYTGVSFLLELEPVLNHFRSYKSQIRRDQKIAEIENRKAEKVARKRKEMEKIKKDNPGLDIDEEIFLADSESEEELEPLFFPEVPNRIIWLKYTKEDTIWLSMAGFDAGIIYEYNINQKDEVPVRFRWLDGAESMEVTTVKEKGILTFMDSSKKRKDGKHILLKDETSVTVHEKCRKIYNKQSYIDAALAEQSSKPSASRRSNQPLFDFKGHCLFCGKDASDQFIERQKKLNQSRREKVNEVTQLDFKQKVIDAAKTTRKSDEWSNAVVFRIENEIDLIAAEGRSTIIAPNKSQDNDKVNTKITSIAHAIIAATRPKSYRSALQVGLGALIHRKYGSRDLLEIVSATGFCCTYNEVQHYEISCLTQRNEDIVPSESLTQFVFDNADLNIDTLDGTNTFHAMEGIQCTTPEPSKSEGTIMERVKKIPNAGTLGEFGAMPIVAFQRKAKTGLYQIGSSSLESIIGSNFGQVKFSRKKRVLPMRGFTSSVKLHDEVVPVDLYTIFRRISFHKKTEYELKNYFTYELAPYPPSLFDEQGMMRKSRKSVFYDLFNPVETPSNIGSALYVIDGGFLLHRVPWELRERFSSILNKYVEYVKKYFGSRSIIVFDGYPDDPGEKSTKSAERLRRNKFMAANVKFDESMLLTISKDKFLSNEGNKKRMISMLIKKFSEENISVEQAAEDADITIVRRAMENATHSECVVVVGEDIDLLVNLWNGHDMDPVQWGWKITKHGLLPVPSTAEQAPQELLNNTACKCSKCSKGCRNACGCRKQGMKCSPICYNCRGASCSNTPDEIIDDTNLMDDEVKLSDNDDELDELPDDEDLKVDQLIQSASTSKRSKFN
ncbi:unnamed protein product [Ceutorhynchus assimilis]|uniref:Uncharacterized protein n=1 Tax=Ceutorhynchus assimilis TaxID=467358 RepID=A0A9N9QAU8_9CUCU|nr:unnamed protein product [Ceutorhynchus assimilis]